MQGAGINMQNHAQSLEGTRDRVEEMQSLFGHYAQDLPLRARRPSKRHHGDLKTVILTGSTGSIGSFLLDCMMRNGTIAKVYCLNRAGKAPSVERQRNTMRTNGLSTMLPSPKIVFLEANLIEPYFGLPRVKYLELLEHVTHIVHQAWQVNFIQPLVHFEPAIQGVRRLVDFCAQSVYNPSLFFASTIGAVSKWTDHHPNPVPEMLMTDWLSPGEVGYSEAKLVCEQLLAKACLVSSLNVYICRIGQVAGPTTPMGHWNPKEWFPSLLASSFFLGSIPKHLGVLELVDWIPVDLLAKSINEIYLDGDDTTVSSIVKNGTDAVLSTRLVPGECRVIHMVNPQKTAYSTLLPSILEYYPSNIQQVTFPDWVLQLEHSQPDRRNPALKLVELYKGNSRKQQAGIDFAQLGTKQTAQESEILRNMVPVTNEWMSNWMRQWNFGREGMGGSRL